MIHFVVSFSAGGGFDIYTRSIAHHIAKHIRGNPSTVVDNMPGADSIVAANYLYKRLSPTALPSGLVT